MIDEPLIRIGVSGVIGLTCAGELASELQEKLLFSEVEVGEAEGKIISGDLDFGVAFVPSPKPELEYLELGTVRFGPFVREDLYTEVGAANLPYAVPASELPQNPLGYRSRDGWPDKIDRRAHFGVSGFAIALDLLRSGQSAVYMPDFVAALENSKAGPRIVAVREHKSAQTIRKLFLVKRQARDESIAMKKVAKVIRRICCAKN